VISIGGLLILALFWLASLALAYGAGCWAMHCGRTTTNPIPPLPTIFKREQTNGEATEPPRHPRVGIPSRAGNSA
jgi:hypothetical protein